MKHSCVRNYLIPAGICLLVILGILYYYFFSAMLPSGSATKFVYIDNDDNIDSVYAKLTPNCSPHALSGFRTLTRHSSYGEHIKPGRYAIKSGQGAFVVFRHLKNGLQEPVSLTVPSVRTLDKLSAEVCKRLMMDSTQLLNALRDPKICAHYGYDTATIQCMFIPNTYDVYWNISAEKLLDRLQKESKNFWNVDRTVKANELKLTPVQVITLASIVDEETANNAEKPMVAGMYYNRLMLRNAEYPNGMPLQADPTIKYAWKQFGLKRIYNKLLSIDSPYNTYRNAGLPPGPIRIPSIEGIEAVLNLKKHDYLYMCAKEDFSGTHNFARTYAEHLANAAKYTKALNQRGIK